MLLPVFPSLFVDRSQVLGAPIHGCYRLEVRNRLRPMGSILILLLDLRRIDLARGRYKYSVFFLHQQLLDRCQLVPARPSKSRSLGANRRRNPCWLPLNGRGALQIVLEMDAGLAVGRLV